MGNCDVVIVNYNAGAFLRDAVASAFSSPAVARVFVIDNASTDESLGQLRPDPRLSVVRNAANLGFAAACNIGLALTSTDYVLLLNPDCRLSPGAVERLIEGMASSDRVGMTGPLLLNPDGTEQAGARRVIPTPWRSFVRTFGLSRLRRISPDRFSDFLLHEQPLPPVPIEVEAISGACMMVRRAALAEVGPFDERYFLHCEDLDWCVRFHDKGWTILFVPDATVSHEKGVSSSRTPLRVEWYKHRGMVRFYSKFLHKHYPLAVRGLIILGIWARFAVIAGWWVLSPRRLLGHGAYSGRAARLDEPRSGQPGRSAQ